MCLLIKTVSQVRDVACWSLVLIALLRYVVSQMSIGAHGPLVSC